MGIAVGNDPKQIKVYKKQFRVAFPVFPDKKYEIHALLGSPSTPTMIVAAKNQKVLMTHKGMIEDLDKMLKEIRELHKNH
ncbi:MAG: hypothetical protein KKE57_05100 [Proteobacteria bacterium]|nr:hypothetical protein [Pseudomonadota bacterium]